MAYWMKEAREKMQRKGTVGALTRQARAAGKTVKEFCRTKHKGTTARRYAFAKAAGKSRKGRRGRATRR